MCKIKNISILGRITYQLMCTEKYLNTKLFGTDFKPLFSILWKVTNGMWLDTFSDYIIDLLPENFFEFKNYDEQEWLILTKEEYDNLLPIIKLLDDNAISLLNLLNEQAVVYAYSIVPKDTSESIDIVNQTMDILKENNIKLPNIEYVTFTTIEENDGWGLPFDATKFSLFLNE